MNKIMFHFNMFCMYFIMSMISILIVITLMCVITNDFTPLNDFYNSIMRSQR